MDFFKIKKYYVQVKEFLLGNANRNFLTFLFFLIISAVFWLMQALNETYEVELDIPIKSVNVPRDIVITTDLPKNLHAVVRDKGTVLVRYLYGADAPLLNVDYNNYDNGMESGRVLVDMNIVQKSVQTQLLASTQIVSIAPDTLEYYYNRGASKKVPVMPYGTVTTSPECYVHSVAFTPDSVMVFAPSSILDTIKAAYVQTAKHANLSKSLHLKEELLKVKGGKFIPDQVDMDVFVDVFTEKEVQVPITTIDFPKGKKIRTFPSMAKVVFRVGISYFKEVSANDFVIAISYDDVLKCSASKLDLRLVEKPKGVSNIRIIPESVDYLLEQTQDAPQ